MAIMPKTIGGIATAATVVIPHKISQTANKINPQLLISLIVSPFVYVFLHM